MIEKCRTYIYVQVVVNPYKRYPIYTHRVCKIYLGKRRNEAKLHYFLTTNLGLR